LYFLQDYQRSVSTEVFISAAFLGGRGSRGVLKKKRRRRRRRRMIIMNGEGMEKSERSIIENYDM
jgi:hypothetical protein